LYIIGQYTSPENVKYDMTGYEVLFTLLSEVDIDFCVEFDQVFRVAARVAEKLVKSISRKR